MVDPQSKYMHIFTALDRQQNITLMLDGPGSQEPDQPERHCYETSTRSLEQKYYRYNKKVIVEEFFIDTMYFAQRDHAKDDVMKVLFEDRHVIVIQAVQVMENAAQTFKSFA